MLLRQKQQTIYLDWVNQECEDIILEVQYTYESGTDGDYYTAPTAPEVSIRDVIDVNGSSILDKITSSEIEEMEDSIIEREEDY